MKQLLFLILLLINLTAIAQNPPPLKQRSDGSLTQGDTYLAVLKGLQIPSGAVNTLTGSGTRVNLFYNTTDNVLYIHNGVEWKPAIEADLTKFYTKAEVDQLFVNNSNNFIKNNPTSSEGQSADINISGSLKVGGTASTNISNASISMSTQSGGGSINYNGLGFGSAEGNFGLDYGSVRGGTSAGTFRLDKGGIVANESGKSVNLTSSYLYLNDANINRSVNLSPSDLSFRNPGNKTLIVQGDDIPPNSMINISWPIKTGRLALESDFSQYAKLIGDNAFKMDFDNGSGLTLSYLNNTDGVPQKTYLQPGSILLLSDTIGGSKPPYLSLTPDGVSFAKGNASARIYVSDPLTTSRSIILRDKDITVAGLEDLTDYAKLNQSNTFSGTQKISDQLLIGYPSNQDGSALQVNGNVYSDGYGLKSINGHPGVGLIYGDFTQGRDFLLQDKSGIIALMDDIPVMPAAAKTSFTTDGTSKYYELGAAANNVFSGYNGFNDGYVPTYGFGLTIMQNVNDRNSTPSFIKNVAQIKDGQGGTVRIIFETAPPAGITFYVSWLLTGWSEPN
ncbi:hypothetical protein ACTJKC_24795 [Pedobacter sp. 22226]|uniref:hypothetical protein n=1 Tax=Pedobacter sp. 22226 TaxID=3453894 RepID=UPI003F83BF1D